MVLKVYTMTFRVFELTQKLPDVTPLPHFYNAIYETFLSTAAGSLNVYENDTATKQRVKAILHPTF